MRFMMIMIPNISEEDWPEDPAALAELDAVAEMSKFNDELTKAGVLLAADGLERSAKGARVAFAGGKPSVTDGPFTEAKEAIVSFALVDARSKEEAIELARRFWQVARTGEGAIQQVYGPE